MNHDVETKKMYLIDHYNLHDADIQDIHYESANFNGHSAVYLKITLKNKPLCCPECGYGFPKIKGYTEKRISYTFPTGPDTKLIYRARRYRCPVCGKTYYEPSPFVFKKMRISMKTVLAILEELRSYNVTYSSVAKRYGISVTSVVSIFDQHMQVSRKKLPKYICLDEVYAIRTPGSKYVCMILDFEKQVPVDILPNRFKKEMLDYFMMIPLEERKKVEMVCFDMYPTYRDIVKIVFPNALGVVDHFHVCKEFYHQLDTVRKRIMNRRKRLKEELKQEVEAFKTDFKDNNYEMDKYYLELKKKYRKYDDEYYLLKKFNWLLRHNEESFVKNGETKKYNKHFMKEMSYRDMLDILLECDPALTEAMSLKRGLTEIYERSDYENGHKELSELIARFHGSSISEMRRFGNTLRTWKNEIVNSFIRISKSYRVLEDGDVCIQDHRMHNGIIENRNKIIKCLKHNANGFVNWQRFRNRAMYVLDPEIQPSAEPIYSSKAVPKQKD